MNKSKKIVKVIKTTFRKGTKFTIGKSAGKAGYKINGVFIFECLETTQTGKSSIRATKDGKIFFFPITEQTIIKKKEDR